jgi:hypothetical protein
MSYKELQTILADIIVLSKKVHQSFKESGNKETAKLLNKLDGRITALEKAIRGN